MSKFITVLHQLEQAAERSLREAEKKEKTRLDTELHALASKAVETYHEVIADLTTAHKAKIEIIRWKELLQDPGPAAPVPGHRHEQTAQNKFEAYHAGFLDTVFNLADRKRKDLQKAIEAGRRQDQLTFEQASADYTQQHQQWVNMQTLARDILSKDVQAYQEALERFNPFAHTREIAAPPSFSFHPDYIEVHWFAHPEEVVPHIAVSLTSTGKLSKKDMAASRVHELYQEHIVSYLLRAGREVLALLPVQLAVIHILADLLNPVTGQKEKQCILSAALYPETLARLNFDGVDLSQVLRNFKHNIQFNKTTGFKPVAQLDPRNLPSSLNK
jgi:hypothetical protein